MSSVSSTQLVSVADYLSGELESKTKHEYLGGVVYAMAGARNLHNVISGNIFAALHTALRESACQPYNSDTKVRIQSPTQVRFYYPDAQVVCQPNSPDDSFQDQPTVVVEVLSRKTRRIDEGEKKDAYLSLPSLTVYLLVEQEAALATLFRRSEQGFVREVHEGMSAEIPLPEVGCTLSLADIYQNAKLLPETDGE